MSKKLINLFYKYHLFYTFSLHAVYLLLINYDVMYNIL